MPGCIDDVVTGDVPEDEEEVGRTDGGRCTGEDGDGVQLLGRRSCARADREVAPRVEMKCRRHKETNQRVVENPCRSRDIVTEGRHVLDLHLTNVGG